MTTPGSIGYHFDDVHGHGALLKAQAAELESQYHAIMSDVNACADFWGGAGNAAFTDFVTELNRNFQVIFTQLDDHGSRVQTVGSNMAALDQGIQHGWMA